MPERTIPDWLLDAARIEAYSSLDRTEGHPIDALLEDVIRSVILLCIQEGFDPWKAAERHEGKY